MKIVKLEVENVKKIKAARIDPEGNLVVIGGKNGAGKTSILDAITYALTGKRSQPAKPVRKGAEKASIVCDLGDLVIKRTITKAGGGALVITNAEGDKKASPQTILDRLAAKLLDPLAFARMDPAKQVETLRDLVGLDVSNLDEAKKKLYDLRADANRKIRDAEGSLKSIRDVPDDTPDAEIDVADLFVQKENTEKRNNDRAEAREEIEDGRSIVAEAEAALDQARKDFESTLKDYKDLANEEDEDAGVIGEKIRSAGDVNANVRAKISRETIEAEIKELKEHSDGCSEDIKKVDAKKAEKLAAVKFPVDGLGFGEDGITYNEIPFNQASSAEQLRVSVAAGLAASPELKVLLIRDGSLMDADSMKVISELAEAADAQIWIERVGTDDQTSVVIEDGEVAN